MLPDSVGSAMMTLVAGMTVASLVLLVYHHAIYPALLWAWARRHPVTLPSVSPRRYRPTDADRLLPSVVVLVPAFNEAAVIGDKIRNLAVLDYPAERLRVVIACDGCGDETAAIARAVAEQPECRHLRVEVREFSVNRGKLALINALVPEMGDEVIALSDASALVSVDALLIAARRFTDPQVGVVCGTYRLLRAFGAGEAAYWGYQTKLRDQESVVGGAIGAHGAFYLFRARLFRSLAADTINDDFVLPMSIVAHGARAVSDPRIVAIELERATAEQDRRRRQRIAAGNLQQLLRLRQLIHPRFGGTAFAFASGKGLRAITPLLLLLAVVGSLALAGQAMVFAAPAVVAAAACGVTVASTLWPGGRWPRTVDRISYVVSGYVAAFVGSCRYLLGREGCGWGGARRHGSVSLTASAGQALAWTGVSMGAATAGRVGHIHPCVRILKRTIDVAAAITLLTLTSPVFALAALAIKLDSKGPVFFRQLRIGECGHDHVRLIRIIKFRSMREDAESMSGAVWASDDDPRVTRVGNILRRSRLDELPQLLNVLRGEMSLIGPRPERPTFHHTLNSSLPFYAERLFGVLPGITGFAQVNLGSDHCLDDVRRKLFYDHAYAMALSRPLVWLRLELLIVARTVVIMIAGPGWLAEHPLCLHVPSVAEHETSPIPWAAGSCTGRRSPD
ncbi:MAG: sugar transferase [Rhodospirillales bacterium]|nr:sugar transferase [Rhodospirillales bacterium]